MTKQEILDYFKDINEVYNDCTRLDSLARMLNEVTASREWIPVTERIPADGSDILAYYDNKIETRIIPCNYYKGEWSDCVFNTERVFKYITHWMPLPNPPKKDGGMDADG